ncbi:MAG TPA: hypothetical protein VNL14_21080, partial [Candidatus Acidoferrales bacterium]|nr:hypothetical protein [Candidatus Acidoferrales bacterium]
VQDNSGKLSGNGFANATEEGFDIALNFTLLGSVKGKDNITTVKLTMSCMLSAITSSPVSFTKRWT